MDPEKNTNWKTGFTSLPTPMTARVYVNLPEGKYHISCHEYPSIRAQIRTRGEEVELLRSRVAKLSKALGFHGGLMGIHIIDMEWLMIFVYLMNMNM